MNWFQGYDQIGNSVVLALRPQRIVSLVPSITEYLSYLGLDAEVAGITKFCVHPQRWYSNKQRVGGTKTINLQVVQTIRPDFIIANKEENTLADIEALSQVCPVYVSDIASIQDALNMMIEIGKCCGRENLANQLVNKLLEMKSQIGGLTKVSAAYLMWYDPYMAAARNTFIHSMMELFQLENCFGNFVRYPVVEIQNLAQAKPDIVLLSSEPFPFKDDHVMILRPDLPNSHILLTDGELWSWYGSRMLEAFEHLWNWRMRLNDSIQ
jgi:ABC-type Fe3+-hydroxamate transport system substrate-binding protein